LAGLVRTGVGRFRREEGTPLGQSKPEHLIPLREALAPMPMVELTEKQTRDVREGRAVGMADPPDRPLVALIEPNGLVFSVARVIGNLLQPECVIPAEVPHGAIRAE